MDMQVVTQHETLPNSGGDDRELDHYCTAEGIFYAVHGIPTEDCGKVCKTLVPYAGPGANAYPGAVDRASGSWFRPIIAE